MIRVLRGLKSMALGATQRTGIGRIVRGSPWRRNRLLILCYHGVSLGDEHEWSDLYVSQEHLRLRFERLRRSRCAILPLGEALQRLATGTLPPRSVALTFDDGAHDFHARAYPLLQEFGYHATLYLTTYYCDVQLPVFNTITSWLLWRGRGRPVNLDLGGLSLGTVTIPGDTPGQRALHATLRARAGELRLDAIGKDLVVQQLAPQVGVDYQDVRSSRLLHLMTREEVGALDPSLVSVQLHTHRHRTPRDHALFLRELRDNATAIQAMRGSEEPIEHFCYPSGDWDRAFIPWLREAGVVSATTCAPQLATRGTDPFLLPRLIDTMQTPDAVFQGWIDGIAALLPQRATVPSAVT